MLAAAMPLRANPRLVKLVMCVARIGLCVFTADTAGFSGLISL
jgi:hypothetical protein